MGVNPLAVFHRLSEHKGIDLNYIAHAWVSRDEGLFALGQLLGDFAISSDLEDAERELIRGVEAHRALDRYIDAHEAFIAGSQILRKGAFRYAPVVMDILIDHILARNWAELNNGNSFKRDIDSLYEQLQRHESLLPDRMKKVAIRMRTQNWFVGFPLLEGLRTVLYYLAKRARKPHWIDAVMPVIVEEYDQLEMLCMEILGDKQLIAFSGKSFDLQLSRDGMGL
jgi:acyl carrier protein phosphodiesterase